MRLVVITFGSEGDNRPLLALSKGLIERGHRVTVLLERSASELATKTQIPFQVLAGDIKETILPGGAMHFLMNKRVGVQELARACANVARANTQSWMKMLLDHAAGADAIVFSGFSSYVALSVAEHLKIPAVAAGLYPISPTREFPSSLLPGWQFPSWLNRASHRVVMSLMWRMFRQSINEARRDVCADEPRKGAWRDYPVVYGISPVLVPQPLDWPSHWQMTGAWYTAIPDWQPSPELTDFLDMGEKPLYLGFGSMGGFDPQRTLNVIAEAVGRRRVLFYPGWSGADTASLPANFFTLGETSHDWVFPRTSMVIHHGGAGTTHTALCAGVPSVVLPFAGDQFFWAHRLANAGAAPDAVPHAKFTAESLARSIAAAESKSMVERAAFLGRQMQEEDGIQKAAMEIERFVRAGRMAF